MSFRFVWDEAKYPTMSPLREIVDNIHSFVAKVEDDLKVLFCNMNAFVFGIPASFFTFNNKVHMFHIGLICPTCKTWSGCLCEFELFNSGCE